MLIKRQLSLNTVMVPERKAQAGPLRRLQQQGTAHEQQRSEDWEELCVCVRVCKEEGVRISQINHLGLVNLHILSLF